MKKLMTAVLMLAGLMAFASKPVMAQNKQGRYDANAVGAVNYSLNSGGSFWGQLFSSGSSSKWSLGFGSSQSTSGSGVLSWDSNGHVALNGMGQAPAISSCGSSPSVVTGSDQAGDVTVGSSASSTCALTFAVAYSVAPNCVCSNKSRVAPCNAQATTTTLTLGSATNGSLTSTDVLSYICIGQ